MLTFLELYQTLLGFVLYKLYSNTGLVYPPPLDTRKDEGAAGVGAFQLQEASQMRPETSESGSKTVEVDGRKISSKSVRQAIKNIANADSTTAEIPADASVSGEQEDADEDFVPRPSKADNQVAQLPTLKSISILPTSLSTSLFSPYTFFISRETSRPIFEFLVRSFGGRIGWPASSGGGSPFEETDDSITHVIIDRPVVEKPNETPEERERRLRRKYVQPQWVVDCVNAGKILLEDLYAQGQTLPPHLSPFGEHEGAYDPVASAGDAMEVDDDSADESVEDAEETSPMAVPAVKAVNGDEAALRAAEIAAEAAGVDYATFNKELTRAKKRAGKEKAAADGEDRGEVDMNKMMMSNKQKKLYERMKHSQAKKATEVRLAFLTILSALCLQDLAVLEIQTGGAKGTNWEGEEETEPGGRLVTSGLRAIFPDGTVPCIYFCIGTPLLAANTYQYIYY